MSDKKNRIPPDLFFIDKKATIPLQAQLITSVVSLILQSHIPAGTWLPSSRTLAKFLGISRLTVTLAYNELVAQNYLITMSRSGYAVSPNAPRRRIKSDQEGQEADELQWSKRLRQDHVRLRTIIKRRDWDAYPYPFLYGQMDRSLFNHTAWRDCARRALGAKEFDLLAGDWASEDDPMLVDYICTRTLPRRGIQASKEQVLITMGAQNALWIIIDILKHNRKLFIYEEPGYPDVPEMLRFADVPSKGLQIDAQGLDPSCIPPETNCVFVTPSHHVPTGVTMPMDRRRKLLDLAEKEDFLVVEDDYEFELSFLQAPSPALKSLDRSGRVLYVGSFSKSIFPGLRLGYIVAPEPVIRQARMMRTMMLRHPPGHMQRTTAYFLAQGYYDALIVKMREAMRERSEALSAALLKTDLQVVGKSQHGGTSFWIKGPDYLDSEVFAQKLEAHGVLIEPGHPFFSDPPSPCPYFRLGYSSIALDRIADGVAKIQEVLDELKDNNSYG